MFKITRLVVLILLVVAGGAKAQVTITYASAGKQYFSMIIPDEWRVNVGSAADLKQNNEDRVEPARLISAMPNSGVPLWFGLWVPEDLEKIDEAKEYMTSLGLELLADVVITQRKHETLNAMEVNFVYGTGKKDGEVMDFRAGFFQLSPGQVAIAIYIGPQDTTIRHHEDLLQMVNSLQSLIQ